MLRSVSRAHSRRLTNSTRTKQSQLAIFILPFPHDLSSPRPLPTLGSLDSNAALCVLATKRSRSLRFYSTSEGKEAIQGAEKDQTVSPPPPLASKPIKKPVEPKLTPKKASVSSSTVTSGSTGTTLKSKPTGSSSRTDPHLSANTKETRKGNVAQEANGAPYLRQPIKAEDQGIIKTALNDIDDAMASGAIKPLPPDLEARYKEKPKEPVQTFGGVELKADTFKVWWHKLKEMTKFYFFGVTKLGREHRILASDVRKRLKESEQSGAHGPAQWRDREFLITYRKDLFRLVPFISIIVILEEILPLVIIYAPFLLPSTCKLPAQARRIEDLADEKRWNSLVSLANIMRLQNELQAQKVSGLQPGSKGLLGHEEGLAEGRLDRLPEGSIQLLCRLLGIAPYGPSSYLKFRLRKTLAALSAEDTYFTSPNSQASSASAIGSTSNPISQLSMGELRTVLGRRGFAHTQLTVSELRDNLRWWLQWREHPIEKKLEALLELSRRSLAYNTTPLRGS
ncbi:hypothetical protein CPB86DRAFT_782483 [Serendipita vermifera]|nr:hypothetical protein CPB86DRAFT_782483 [Serendipita vermifera]